MIESQDKVSTLMLGAGIKSIPGAVNVDIRKFPGIDIIHDLNILPWPMKDSSFDVVLAHDLIEHLSDVPKVMSEIWRVCKHDACVHIRVPRFGRPTHYTDPTHVRGFGRRSFDYFDSTSEMFRYGYGGIEDFRVEHVKKQGLLVPGNFLFVLRANKTGQLETRDAWRDFKARVLDLWDWWMR